MNLAVGIIISLPGFVEVNYMLVFTISLNEVFIPTCSRRLLAQTILPPDAKQVPLAGGRGLSG
jgi:hypothetical protein